MGTGAACWAWNALHVQASLPDSPGARHDPALGCLCLGHGHLVPQAVGLDPLAFAHKAAEWPDELDSMLAPELSLKQHTQPDLRRLPPLHKWSPEASTFLSLQNHVFLSGRRSH